MNFVRAIRTTSLLLAFFAIAGVFLYGNETSAQQTDGKTLTKQRILRVQQSADKKSLAQTELETVLRSKSRSAVLTANEITYINASFKNFKERGQILTAAYHSYEAYLSDAYTRDAFDATKAMRFRIAIYDAQDILARSFVETYNMLDRFTTIQ